MTKRKYTDNEILEWYESYKELNSTVKVGKKFGIAKGTIWRKFNLLGLETNNIHERSFTCDDDFFLRDTPESFYWAGFIAADGCVYMKENKYKVLRINLSIKDIKHLEKFKNSIEYSGNILEALHKSYGKSLVKDVCKSSLIAIRSDKIFDNLSRFNVVPRKTLTYTFPKWLTKHPLVNHFMRGYFDGDGGFSDNIAKRETIKQLGFHLCGTYNFLKTFENILSIQCGVPSKSLYKSKNIYNLSYRGNKRVPKIRDFLYKNSMREIRLDRKYNIAFAKEFVDDTDRHRSRYVSVIRVDPINNDITIYKSVKSATEDGFIRQAIISCCRGRVKTHKGYTWRYATEEEIRKYGSKTSSP